MTNATSLGGLTRVGDMPRGTDLTIGAKLFARKHDEQRGNNGKC